MKQFTLVEIKDRIAELRGNAKAIIAIAAFVFLLDGFLMVSFQMIPLVRLWNNTGKVKADINQARQDSKAASSFKNRLADLKNEIEALNKKVVKADGLPKVLETVSKFADISTVKILKIRPMTESRGVQKPIKITSSEELVREKISITANSGFHQMGRFLALLENAPVFFEVKRLEIRGDGQGYMRHSVTIFLDVVLKKS